MSKPWGPNYVVHVDLEGDRERASNGHSRYGSYVGAQEEAFQDHWAKPELRAVEAIQFAAVAWEVASPPIMSPGLLDWRPDIHKITLGYDEDGADLMVTAELPLRHRQLAARIPHTYEDWGWHSHWHGEPYEYLVEPGTRRDRPTVITTVKIRHILGSVTLVTPGAATGRPLVDAALQSVELTAAAINAELPEIINTVLGEAR